MLGLFCLVALAHRAIASSSSCGPNATFLTMGESMLRLQPIDSGPVTSPTRHFPQPFLRSIGGDELNVAVALSLVGVPSRWISVLPTGPLGDVIIDSCVHHSVECVGPRVEGDLGLYWVLPEEKRVHYQRRNAAFARHDPSILEWTALLDAPSPWLHLTGITPLISDAARRSWVAALTHAASQGIPISVDLNHRPQLGSLAELWAIVKPQAHQLDLLILSVGQLIGLAELDGHAPSAALETDEQMLALMSTLQKGWACKRVALCRKERDAGGMQRRWSVMTWQPSPDAPPTSHSTYPVPVWHAPKEDIGGGSAWAAGIVHALHFEPAQTPLAALRRADLLSALAQETQGDFSNASYAELHAAERAFDGVPARIGDAAHEADAAAAAAPADAISPPVPLYVPPLPSASAAAAAVAATHDGLARAGILGILRVKGDDVAAAVARGVELASLGCLALEVTLDSPHWAAVLHGLRQALPAGVLLGIGTVMDETVSEVRRAAALGASFALSPIDPIGFIEECHRHGVLAVPSAFTSNEMYAMKRRGARLLKLFHAGLVSPAILKSMLSVTPLKEQLSIMPSGGVTPENAPEWWKAGAACVGAGTNLVGDDFNHPPGSLAREKAAAAWQEHGREAAAKVFALANTRRADMS